MGWFGTIRRRVFGGTPTYDGAGLGQAHTSPCKSAAEVASHIARLVETGHDRFRTRHRRKDGGILELDISVNFWPGDGGRGVRCGERELCRRVSMR